jgi:hypothetical protein
MLRIFRLPKISSAAIGTCVTVIDKERKFRPVLGIFMNLNGNLKAWAKRIKRDGVTLWFAGKHPTRLGMRKRWDFLSWLMRSARLI